MDKKSLEELSQICIDHDILVIADEAYERIFV